MDPTVGDTLYIGLLSDEYFNPNLTYDNAEIFDLIKYEDDHIIYGGALDINIYGSEKSQFEIEMEKESLGRSVSDALDNIEKMDFDYEWKGDTLLLSPNVLIDEEQKFHGQEIEINIMLPQSKYLYLDKGLERVDSPGWRDDYLGTYLIYDGDDIIYSKELEEREEEEDEDEEIDED